MKSTIIAVLLTLGVLIASVAEDNVLGTTKEAQAACAREFASSKLDPLRSKLPVSWGQTATEGMRKNNVKPSLAERAAVQAFIDADIACQRYVAIDRHPNDQVSQAISVDKVHNGS